MKAIKKATIEGNVSFKKNKQLYYIVAAAVILFAAIFITLNEHFFRIDGIPTWSQLFRAADLNDNLIINGEDVEADVSVHFIDVGQGDCELILTPTKSILIDCGEREYSSDVLAYLSACGIKKLDYVIATHPHSDHIGGMGDIINTLGADTIIMPRVADAVIPITSSYEKMLDAIENKGVYVRYAKAGTSLEVDENCVIEILAPVKDYEDLNNYSVTFKFVHGENSFLFTGDIESDAEYDIIDSGADLSADILKVAHHGSNSSSTKKFLRAVSPQYAVIEVGSPNDYGHPTDKVLNRFGDLGINILRTDKMGSIVFKSDTNLLKAYYTEK